MTVFNTSGTTGKPKTISLTDEQMQQRVLSLDDTTRGTGFSSLKSIFVDFHPDSIIGVRYLQYGSLKGVKIVFPSLGTAEATIAMLIAQGIEGIASTPQGMLNYAQVSKGTYQPKWMMVSTSGLNGATSKAIRAGLGDNLWSSYACSEAGTIAIASAQQVEAMVGCVGTVLPGVTIQFVEGEIVVKTESSIAGYDNDAALTNQKFKDGWYYSGDLGHMSSDLLVFDGRKP
jgi:O-succinylbenzoic acid--CoA ligase